MSSKGQYSEAMKEKTMQYIKENYGEIKLRVPKGDKPKIQAHAAKMNESTNAFIKRAIDETMERDNEQQD